MIFDKISFPPKKLLQETTTRQKISKETNLTATANSVNRREWQWNLYSGDTLRIKVIVH